MRVEDSEKRGDGVSEEEAKAKLIELCGAKWPTKEEADRAHEQMESDSWRRVAERLEAEKVELLSLLKKILKAKQEFQECYYGQRLVNTFHEAEDLIKRHEVRR
jgi:hypothetical protein